LPIPFGIPISKGFSFTFFEIMTTKRPELPSKDTIYKPSEIAAILGFEPDSFFNQHLNDYVYEHAGHKSKKHFSSDDDRSNRGYLVEPEVCKVICDYFIKVLGKN